MKTKDLIRLLNEADPSGESHCCIQNGDVWDVTVEPAYYDGPLHVIDRDEDNRPILGRRIRHGEKVNLSPVYISDGFEYTPFRIEYANEEDRQRYEHIDTENRRKVKQMDIDLDRDTFADWVFRSIQTMRPVPVSFVSRIVDASNAFYDANRMGPDGPFAPCNVSRSHNDRREEYFADTILVEWDNLSRILITIRPVESASK